MPHSANCSYAIEQFLNRFKDGPSGVIIEFAAIASFVPGVCRTPSLRHRGHEWIARKFLSGDLPVRHKLLTCIAANSEVQRRVRDWLKVISQMLCSLALFNYEINLRRANCGE